MELAQQLKSIWSFSDLDAPCLAELASSVRHRQFRAGDTLFHEGDPAHSFYLVLSAAVNLERVLPDGDICHFARFVPHDLVDEITLPNGKPRIEDAVNVGRCESLMVDGAPFIRSLERSPPVANRYMRSVFESQRRHSQNEAPFQMMSIVGRVAVTILSSVKSMAS